MNTPIGDRLFQDIPRRLAKFRENRPRDVEKSVDEKKLNKLEMSVSYTHLTLPTNREV